MRPVRGSGSFMSTVKRALERRGGGRRQRRRRRRARVSSKVWLVEAHERARRLERRPAVDQGEGEVGALQRQRAALGRRAWPPSRCRPPASEASRKEPPCSQPRTRCLTDPVAAARRQRRGPERLEDAGRHRPDLAVEARLHGAGHVRHVALGGNLGAAGPQLELAEHDAAALRREEPARRPVVDRPAAAGCGGSAPIQPPADLRSKAQPGPSGALRGVHDAAGELHAAVAPHQHRGRDLEPARGAVVGQRQMAAVDAQRRRRQPRQQHLSRRRVDADGAAQDLAGAGQVELGLAPHRHVEAFQARQLRQRARQPARHQALHGNRELQGLGVLAARRCGS